MPSQSQRSEIEQIRQTVQQFRRAQVYIAFAELGLGEAMERGSVQIDELAKEVHADESALQRFLDAAEAFKLVTPSDDERYSLTELGYDLYAPSSPNSMVNSLRLEGAFYRRWGRLTDAIRMGGRPEENRRQEDDPGWVRMFTMALYESSRESAQAVAQSISPVLKPRQGSDIRLLDLGGGHGGYSIALARERRDITATVFDMPKVIEVTDEIVTRAGMNDRVGTIAGDFHIDPIGSGYDAILLFGVLHGETPEGAKDLLSTIYSALEQDGLLLIRSRGRQSAAPQPGEREIFDLHMLLSTDGGRVQRAGDARSLVESHGFTLDTGLDVISPGTGQVLVFRKS
jgi:2-polyprenyl-3-methyl-5-hydroxy-6-metoxy-1,4-benzoquinol methylase